jgi:cytochrome P450
LYWEQHKEALVVVRRSFEGWTFSRCVYIWVDSDKGSPHCCRQRLARMEMRVMFSELLPRMRSVELAREVTRVWSNFGDGVKQFPIRIQVS